MDGLATEQSSAEAFDGWQFEQDERVADIVRVGVRMIPEDALELAFPRPVTPQQCLLFVRSLHPRASIARLRIAGNSVIWPR
jgi:hypothetical protein